MQLNFLPTIWHLAFAGAEIAIMVPVIKVAVRMIEAMRFIIFIINLQKKLTF